MAHALSDEEAGLQILGIFVRNKVQASGTLRRPSLVAACQHASAVAAHPSTMPYGRASNA